MALADGTTSECRFCGMLCVWETMFRYDARTPDREVPEEEPWAYRKSQYWDHFAPVDQDHPQNCPPVDMMVNDHRTKWKDEMRSVTRRCLPTGYCGHQLTSDRSDYYGQLCNRPVVDDELFMCGIHAGKERERQRQKAEGEARRAQNEFLEDYVETVVKPKLLDLGFPGETLLSWQTWRGGEETRVILNMDKFIEWLLELGKRLENTGDRPQRG